MRINHEPERIPLTRPADTLSPSGGEGRGEGDGLVGRRVVFTRFPLCLILSPLRPRGERKQGIGNVRGARRIREQFSFPIFGVDSSLKLSVHFRRLPTTESKLNALLCLDPRGGLRLTVAGLGCPRSTHLLSVLRQYKSRLLRVKFSANIFCTACF